MTSNLKKTFSVAGYVPSEYTMSIDDLTFSVDKISTNNLVYSWGRNDCGQLTNNSSIDNVYGTSSSTSYPQSVVPSGVGKTAKFKKISAGSNHTHAIATDGSLWGWGSNKHGELGTDKTIGTKSLTFTSGVATGVTYGIHSDPHDESIVGVGTNGLIFQSYRNPGNTIRTIPTKADATTAFNYGYHNTSGINFKGIIKINTNSDYRTKYNMRYVAYGFNSGVNDGVFGRGLISLSSNINESNALTFDPVASASAGQWTTWGANDLTQSVNSAAALDNGSLILVGNVGQVIRCSNIAGQVAAGTASSNPGFSVSQAGSVNLNQVIAISNKRPNGTTGEVSVNPTSISRFIMVGDSDTIKYSTDDGVTWINKTTITRLDPSGNYHFKSITWDQNRNRLYAVGSNTNSSLEIQAVLIYSDDLGITWTEMDIVTLSCRSLRSVVYDSMTGILYMSGDGGCMVKYDAATSIFTKIDPTTIGLPATSTISAAVNHIVGDNGQITNLFCFNNVHSSLSSSKWPYRPDSYPEHSYSSTGGNISLDSSVFAFLSYNSSKIFYDVFEDKFTPTQIGTSYDWEDVIAGTSRMSSKRLSLQDTGSPSTTRTINTSNYPIAASDINSNGTFWWSGIDKYLCRGTSTLLRNNGQIYRTGMLSAATPGLAFGCDRTNEVYGILSTSSYPTMVMKTPTLFSSFFYYSSTYNGTYVKLIDTHAAVSHFNAKSSALYEPTEYPSGYAYMVWGPKDFGVAGNTYIGSTLASPFSASPQKDGYWTISNNAYTFYDDYDDPIDWLTVKHNNNMHVAISKDGTKIYYNGLKAGIGITSQYLSIHNSGTAAGAIRNDGFVILATDAIGWKSIAVCSRCILAVKKNGTLWGIGWGQNGTLGLGNTPYSVTSFTQIGTATNWNEVYSNGKYLAGALTTSGSVYMWGSVVEHDISECLKTAMNIFNRFDVPTPTYVTTYDTWVSTTSIPLDYEYSYRCGYSTPQLINIPQSFTSLSIGQRHVHGIFSKKQIKPVPNNLDKILVSYIDNGTEKIIYTNPFTGVSSSISGISYLQITSTLRVRIVGAGGYSTIQDAFDEIVNDDIVYITKYYAGATAPLADAVGPTVGAPRGDKFGLYLEPGIAAASLTAIYISSSYFNSDNNLTYVGITVTLYGRVGLQVVAVGDEPDKLIVYRDNSKISYATSSVTAPRLYSQIGSDSLLAVGVYDSIYPILLSASTDSDILVNASVMSVTDGVGVNMNGGNNGDVLMVAGGIGASSGISKTKMLDVSAAAGDRVDLSLLKTINGSLLTAEMINGSIVTASNITSTGTITTSNHSYYVGQNITITPSGGGSITINGTAYTSGAQSVKISSTNGYNSFTVVSTTNGSAVTMTVTTSQFTIFAGSRVTYLGGDYTINIANMYATRAGDISQATLLLTGSVIVIYATTTSNALSSMVYNGSGRTLDSIFGSTLINKLISEAQ